MVAAVPVLAVASLPDVASSAAPAVDTPSFLESSVSLGVAESGIDTWGLGVWDWNEDGCDDMYIGRHRQTPRLYRNGCPGVFVNERFRLPADEPRTNDRHGLAFGDYDGDGRADLFVSAGGDNGTGPGSDDQLYHQLPDGTFEDVAPAEGMTNAPASGRFGIWFDYDSDGDLDLLEGNKLHPQRPEENRNSLWRNEAGHFTNVAAEAGINTSETSSSGAATDFDSDGDYDVITAPGSKPSVYVNQGNGTFVKTTLGVRTEFGKPVSIAPADYDNDGDIDLFLMRSGKGKSQLLRNDGPGNWRDVTDNAKVEYTYGTSAVWVDANADGWLDLFIVRLANSNKKFLNLLLMNEGNGTFTNVAAAAGVTGPTDVKAKRGAGAWGDFDRDGRVDLAVLTKGSATAVHVYLNQTANGNGWITLRLRDPASVNREAIGAKVRITAGGTTQYREAIPAIAEWSQSPPYLMVGLGTNQIVSSLEITWPDGTTSTFTDVAINKHYLATYGGGLTETPSSPQTAIDDAPPTPTNETTATFDFSGSDLESAPGTLRFECDLGGSGWAACTSPKGYSDLPPGSHTFQVRAIDQAGSPDPTPASHTWTIDTTPPETTINSGPPDETSSTSATFDFSGLDDHSPPAALTFECQLDGGGWTSCTSPKDYTDLAPGVHTFMVRATDQAGNVDPTAASDTWTII
jgi:hypothetical protein